MALPHMSPCPEHALSYQTISAVPDSRHVCFMKQQTCLMCATADKYAATCLLSDTAGHVLLCDTTNMSDTAYMST